MSKDETNREHVRADLGAAEGKAMTKGEKNRLIAEWVGLRPTTDGWWPQTDGKAFPYPPDFFTSEEANALVLEKLSREGIELKNFPDKYYLTGKLKTPTHWVCIPKSWTMDRNGCTTGRPFSSDPDRKTAVVEAALKYLSHKGVK